VIASGIRTWARILAPWVVASISLQAGLRLVWPRQVAAALRDARAASELRGTAPDPAALRRTADSLASDSTRLSERLATLSARTLGSEDPAAELASRLVPVLAGEGWKLQKVKAESRDGWALLDLGAEADFPRTLDGIRRIRTDARALQVRRFALRPGSGGRLLVDLQIASPARRNP